MHRSHAADGDVGQGARRGADGLAVYRRRVLERRDEPVRTGALGRTSDGPEITYVGHPVEDHEQGRFVVRHPFEQVVESDIADGGNLRHRTLVVAPRQPVELLDGHLLHAEPVPQA